MSQQKTFHTRRKFLKGAGVTGLATALLPGQPVAAQGKSATRAKNLIVLVVDGMSSGALALAHHWKLRQKGELLNWMQLYERADLRRATQDTASNSSPVTDSAAAASAWGCGHRVDNGAINVSPQGRVFEPLLVRAKRAGKRTGLVTTCRVSHATPAGFAANVSNRGEEDRIVAQYLERKIDLLLGGGARHFTQTGKNGESEDLFKAYAATEYKVARDRSQLKSLSPGAKRFLGIFAHSHIPYAIDRQSDPALADTPGLPEMFEAALVNLEGAKEGFVLQVEGGRVDHAGHANDPAAILHEQLEFDECIPIATEFLERNPETMLIVTTDHGTAGCQLDGLGRAYAESGPALGRINQYNYSFEWLENRFRESGGFDPELFKEATGLTASEPQAAQIQAAIEGGSVTYLNSFMTRTFADQLKNTSAVGWTSNNHTAENVELLAFGPGSEQLPGFIRNHELHGIMTSALHI